MFHCSVVQIEMRSEATAHGLDLKIMSAIYVNKLCILLIGIDFIVNLNSSNTHKTNCYLLPTNIFMSSSSFFLLLFCTTHSFDGAKKTMRLPDTRHSGVIQCHASFSLLRLNVLVFIILILLFCINIHSFE